MVAFLAYATITQDIPGSIFILGILFVLSACNRDTDDYAIYVVRIPIWMSARMGRRFRLILGGVLVVFAIWRWRHP